MKKELKFGIGLIIFVIVFSLLWFYIIPENFSDLIMVEGTYETKTQSGKYIFGYPDGIYLDNWNFYGYVILLIVIAVLILAYFVFYFRQKKIK